MTHHCAKWNCKTSFTMTCLGDEWEILEAYFIGRSGNYLNASKKIGAT